MHEKSVITPTTVSPHHARETLRSQMEIVQKWAYFDHAAVAPLPTVARDKMIHWIGEAASEGDVAWGRWNHELQALREVAARLLHAQPSEIGLVGNTSTGINLVAHGIRWEPGDNVVVPNNEFSSNYLPWRNLEHRGVEIRTVAAEADGELSMYSIERAIDKRTRLLAISWIGYVSGFRISLSDVSALCQCRGIRLFLDAIQGLGAYPINLSETRIDFLAADGHKWMLGPEGMGILYVRQDVLDELSIPFVGWGSVAGPNSFGATETRWKPDCSRYEIGSANMIGATGLRASLELLCSLGCHQHDSPVAAAINENVAWLRGQLEDQGYRIYSSGKAEHSSGILSIRHPRLDAHRARSNLLDLGVVVSVRSDWVRVSTHAYNDEADCVRLIESLERIRN